VGSVVGSGGSVAASRVGSGEHATRRRRRRAWGRGGMGFGMGLQEGKFALGGMKIKMKIKTL
jgi:hypothetical protein